MRTIEDKIDAALEALRVEARAEGMSFSRFVAVLTQNIDAMELRRDLCQRMARQYSEAEFKVKLDELNRQLAQIAGSVDAEARA